MNPSFNNNVIKPIQAAAGNSPAGAGNNSSAGASPSPKSSNAPSPTNAKAFAQGNDIHFGDPAGKGNNLAAHEAAHVVQQGQSAGFSKQGSKELMEGNVPSNAVDRARLRSNVPHPGAAGAPIAAGPNSLANGN
jgi:hypothetical protein